MPADLPRTRRKAGGPPPAEVIVRAPPMRAVMTPTWELVEHIRATLGAGDGAALFDRVARLLEATSTLEFAAIRRRLARNFAPFSAAGTGRALPRRLDKPAPTPADLDAREDAFLADFHALLDAAHFRQLSAGEWATAQAENFTFNSPVEVNWGALDTSLLARFWAARPAERARAAPVADRILIYHRGVKTVRAEGRFIDDKVDLLVEYLLVGPLTRAAAAVAGAVGRAARWARPGGDAAAGGGGGGGGGASAPAPAGADVALALQRAALGADAAPGAETVSAADAATEAAALAEELAHANAQVVKRVSPRMLMPSAWAVLKALPRVLTISEPAYRDVVVLYRAAVPAAQVRKREKDPVWDWDAGAAARNIHVKRFVDVPMADVEMIFPDKTVWLKPLLLMQLAATLVGGLVAAAALLRPKKGGAAAAAATSAPGSGSGSADAADAAGAAAAARASLQVAVAALTLIGGRAAQVYGQAAAARQAVADAITQRLYDTTMDAQEADVSFLMDEMAAAHVKEAALAYFMLLAKKTPLTCAALDAAIERYLARTFGERVDFAIEASLPRLVADGLVVPVKSGGGGGGGGGEQLYAAVPLDEAARALSAKWAAAAEAPDDGGAGAMALFTRAGAGVSGAAGAGAAAVGRGAAAVGRGLGRGLHAAVAGVKGVVAPGALGGGAAPSPPAPPPPPPPPGLGTSPAGWAVGGGGGSAAAANGKPRFKNLFKAAGRKVE